MKKNLKRLDCAYSFVLNNFHLRVTFLLILYFRLDAIRPDKVRVFLLLSIKFFFHIIQR